MARAVAAGFNLRRLDGAGVAIALDETVTAAELSTAGRAARRDARGAPASIPAALVRTGPVLPQAVFGAHRSEHEMLRYLKRLEDRDVALNRSMIPLGSCTMKLNATAEMVPITLPGFADIHPFAPAEQTAGYATMIERLAAGWRRPPGSRPCRCSRTPGRRGSMPGCWRSAPTTPRAGRGSATSA